jgi:hypothetical protein
MITDVCVCPYESVIANVSVFSHAVGKSFSAISAPCVNGTYLKLQRICVKLVMELISVFGSDPAVFLCYKAT